jgi:hypothetical protein
MNYNQNNKKIVERQIRKYVSCIAQKLKLQIEEWDFDSQLYSAIVSSLEVAHTNTQDSIREYAHLIDGLLETAHVLNLNLNKEYYWYRNIHEIKQITQQYGNY